MKRILICLIVAAMVIGVAYAAYAGAEEDAKKLAQSAAVFIEQNGKDAGIAEIMKPNGKFTKGDLFVTVTDFKGVLVASGAFHNLVGVNTYDTKDPNGKPFVQESIELAKTKGGGWMEYVFTDQNTKKIAPRKAWIQRVAGMDLYVSAPITVHK